MSVKKDVKDSSDVKSTNLTLTVKPLLTTPPPTAEVSGSTEGE